MKATIQGIQVEGTPQEIIEFKRMMDNEQQHKFPYTNPYAPSTSPSWTLMPSITCGGLTCPDSSQYQSWNNVQ